MLDAGCGRAAYRDAVPGRYVGVDLSHLPFPVEAGRRLYARAASDRLPFAPDTFDLVFARSAFYQFPQPDLALAEFRSVLKPGGRVLLFDYNRRTQRKLQKGEGAPRPCWTQWQLRQKIERAGFRACEVLPPVSRSLPWAEHWLRLLHQELFGTWAIVTGIK
jgi:SAM-dependent methyltransferase